MAKFYEVKFYFGSNTSEGNAVSSQNLPAFMCIPSILDALAFSHKAIFVTCTKYGCRQFNPWPNNIRPDFYTDYIFNRTNRFDLI